MKSRIPKEHIQKVDLRINEINSIKLNTKESLSKQKFPLRHQQRPRSLKKSRENTVGTSPKDSRGSTRLSEQHDDNLKRVFHENFSTRRDTTSSGKETERNMEDYVKNYARLRYGNQEKKPFKSICKLPILSFEQEVLNKRTAPELQKYPGWPNHKLFEYKKYKTQPRKLKPIGIISIHETCLPLKKYNKFPRQIPRYLYKEKTLKDDMEFLDLPSSTEFWEQYVLSLVSKNTAQWIANQCTTGSKRDHLIQFLDEMYNIDYYEDSAIKTRKLLDNDEIGRAHV